MYYQLHISNNSPVDYDIDVLRFFIRDKKKAKRTAIQETDLKPLHISGNTSQVKANSTSSWFLHWISLPSRMQNI